MKASLNNGIWRIFGAFHGSLGAMRSKDVVQLDLPWRELWLWTSGVPKVTKRPDRVRQAISPMRFVLEEAR